MLTLNLGQSDTNAQSVNYDLNMTEKPCKKWIKYLNIHKSAYLNSQTHGVIGLICFFIKEV